jgi:hypothetical protein
MEHDAVHPRQAIVGIWQMAARILQCRHHQENSRTQKMGHLDCRLIADPCRERIFTRFT